MQKRSFIKVKQTNGDIYFFSDSWLEPGGKLYSDNNFLAEISLYGKPLSNAVKIAKNGDVWEVSSAEDDPQFVLLLWKHGRGDDFEFLIEDKDLLFLHKFYEENKFDMMAAGIAAACQRIYGKNYLSCSLF